MQRDSSPWSAPAGRRHDSGHTDEGDYIRRGAANRESGAEAGHRHGDSGGQRSAGGSNYGDWRGNPGHEPDPYAGGDRWNDGRYAAPPDRYGEAGERRRAPSQGYGGGQDVPGRYQGGYRGGYGQGDQGAGGFQGSPQRSQHSGYPGMYEDPYAGPDETGSYSGPYGGHRGSHARPKGPSYGRWEAPGQNERHGDSRQDSAQAGYSGGAWADRDWQQDHAGSQGGAHGAPPDHDPDYHQWRNEQMRRLDEDYRLWRQDRYKKFTEDFDTWRSQRQQQQQGGAGETGGRDATAPRSSGNEGGEA